MSKQVELAFTKKDSKNISKELDSMRLKLEAVTNMIYTLRQKMHKNKESDPDIKNNDIYNKDGVPFNSSFVGFTKKSPYPYILTVDDKGYYYIGNNKFKSLSSAAEFASGVRRSGWTFWKLFEDGRTLKEVYKK
jgi:hypothetical protein